MVELSFKRISELTSKLEAEQAKTAEAEARVRMLGETANRLHTTVMAQEKEVRPSDGPGL